MFLSLSLTEQLPVFKWEQHAYPDLVVTSEYLQSHHHIAFIICIIYYVLISVIPVYMKNKPAKDWKLPLAGWSLLLALFSFFGSIRVIPNLINRYRTEDINTFICSDSRHKFVYDGNPVGFWIYLFVLSKIPELVDTLFVVFRKRKVLTLQWYHHITVLIMCWNTWATMSTSGPIFAGMNYFVHAFMYFFYFLAALGYKPKIYAQSITLLQIFQMVIGTLVSIYSVMHLDESWTEMVEYLTTKKYFEPSYDVSLFKDECKCCVHPGNALYGLLVYVSYLYLFILFFYNAYISKKK